MGIEITPRAVENIRAIMQSEGKKEDAFLRLSVKGGGCSGMSYDLAFDNQLSAMDKSMEIAGLRVVVDAKSYLYLNGMTLDYTTGLSGRGFVFSNPNAKSTCGCGESFSV